MISWICLPTSCGVLLDVELAERHLDELVEQDRLVLDEAAVGRVVPGRPSPAPAAAPGTWRCSGASAPSGGTRRCPRRRCGCRGCRARWRTARCRAAWLVNSRDRTVQAWAGFFVVAETPLPSDETWVACLPVVPSGFGIDVHLELARAAWRSGPARPRRRSWSWSRCRPSGPGRGPGAGRRCRPPTGTQTPALYRSATTFSAWIDSGVLSRHFLPSASKRSPPNARSMPTMYSLAVTLPRPGRYAVDGGPAALALGQALGRSSSGLRSVQLPSAGGIFRPAFSIIVLLM